MTDVKDNFTALLHKIAKEQHFVNYELNIKPISSEGANYTSKLYIVNITEDDKVLNMFAKLAAIGEKFRAQGPRFYETERYVYTKLDKIYENLQEEHEVPEEHRLHFPKFFGCNPLEYEETIVLENLVAAGYHEYDRFKSVDWPYASSAIKELAKMHALSFAFKKYQPEEFEEAAKKLKYDFNLDDPNMEPYMDRILTGTLSIVSVEHKEKLETFFADLTLDFMASVMKPIKQTVLSHGDYRPSNLMHKHYEEGTVHIKIVDLQTIQGGSPVMDLLYFIVTGSDEEFRAQYYDRLIDYYYEQLSEAMKRLHLDPDESYSRADFDYELKEKLPIGLSLGVFMLPIVTVGAANAPTVDENMDLTSFTIETSNALYAERLNGVVNDFVKWGVLK